MLTVHCKMKQKIRAVKRSRNEALSPGWGGGFQSHSPIHSCSGVLEGFLKGIEWS